MHVLMISIDGSIFDGASSSFARMRRYADAAGELLVLVPYFFGKQQTVSSERGNVRVLELTPLRFLDALLFGRLRGQPLPDLVTAQDPLWTGFLAWLLARRFRRPLEVQLHGDPWAGKSFSRFGRSLALWLLPRADGIRVVSERLRTRLVAAGIPADRIAVIPIGLLEETSNLSPQFFRPPGFENVFTYVGRLVPGKGLRLLLDAFAEFHRTNPKSLLFIIGEGSERASLERRARDLQLATEIRFLGWVRDPRGVMAASDALLLPSESEGWGRTPVEALSLGVPVIMTDVGLAGDVVQDGVNGLVVPCQDQDAFRGALLRFVAEPGLRASLTHGARESRARLPLFGDTVARVADSWKRIFEKVSGEDPGKTSGSDSAPSRRALIVIFLFALLLRLFFFGLVAREGTDAFYRFSDGNEYLVVARNLLSGNGFSVRTEPPYVPYSYYVPGYPFLLAAFLAVGLGVRAVILLQVFVGALTAAALAAFGSRLVGRRAAIFAGVLLAIEPSTILWNNQIVTETLSTAFLILGLFIFSHTMRFSGVARAAAAGFLLGLATLVRHAMQFLILLYPLTLLLFGRALLRKRLTQALVMIVCSVAILSPWIVRNRLVYDRWFYSTAAGGIALGKTLQFYAQVRLGKQLHDIFPRPEVSETPDGVSIENAFFWPRAAIVLFKNDPFGYLAVQMGGLVPFFFGDGYTQIRTVLTGGEAGVPGVIWDGNPASLPTLLTARPDILPFLLGKIVWALLTLLALVGFLFGWKRRPEQRGAFVAILMTIFYFALGSGVGGYSRFRFPVTPLVLLLAAYGFTEILRRKRGGSLVEDSRPLLIVTQAVDRDHPVLGFFHQWIVELAGRFPSVKVLALQKGSHDLPANVRLIAPRNGPKILRNALFLFELARLVPRSRGVFFHMCPEYALAASPFTFLFRKPTLLWYTHREVTLRLRLAAFLVRNVFTASRESCQIKSSNVVVTGHGIPLADPVRQTLSSDFRILVVGRVAPIKRIETVIEALSLLRKRGVSATLAIVGAPVYPGDQDYLKNLESRVDALGLGSYTRFVGTVKHDALREIYRDVDTLVNASPNGPDKVVYEAAALGIPPVAAHPAFRELFGTRVEKLSFPSGDAAALADRLNLLASLPSAERASIGAEVREAARRNHSLSNLADRIASFFRS